jgi:8-oxo-dGTP pyrophosphatase MutT (NUDIX family)
MVTHAGGLVMREHDGTIEIAIVTSSSGVGWVLPKGMIDPGETAEEAALREVEEEAALVCEIVTALGDATITKHLGGSVETTFFLMRVVAAVEMSEDRELRWCDVATARTLISAPGAHLILDRAEPWLRATHLHR